MEFRALSRAILLHRRRWNFGDQWKVGRREYPDHQQSRQHATVLHPPPQIMQKHTRGQERPRLEGAYRAYDELLVKDTYPTLEGLKNTLKVQASFDSSG